MMARHFQKRRLIVYVNIIKDRRDHSYDAENLICDEVMERQDYIRMDQEIIRTFAKSLTNNIQLKLKHCFFLHTFFDAEKQVLHRRKLQKIFLKNIFVPWLS